MDFVPPHNRHNTTCKMKNDELRTGFANATTPSTPVVASGFMGQLVQYRYDFRRKVLLPGHNYKSHERHTMTPRKLNPLA